MIARARWLTRAAEPAELSQLVLVSGFTVIVLGSGGMPLTKAMSKLAGPDTGFTETYVSSGMAILGSGLLLAFGVFTASASYRMLIDTIGRCELAKDEMAWINQSPEYERMIEDRELLRLAANVGQVCRTYLATYSLFVRFLSDYRTLLNEYGKVLDKTIEQARIELLNNQAEEGLEQYAARVRREGMRKEREGRSRMKLR